MNALKLSLLVCLIAVLRNTPCFGSSLSPSRIPCSSNRCKRPPVSKTFEKASVPVEHVHISMIREEYNGTKSFSECHSEALATGAQAFILSSNVACYLYFLRYPLCKKWNRPDSTVYIRKDYYTDGDQCDNATMNPQMMDTFGPTARSFRIESPTILNFEDHSREVNLPDYKDLEYYTYVVRADAFFAYVDRSILADPRCYTKSTCGHVFVTTSPEIPADDLLVLHDICGQNVQVGTGQSLYILSHEGIGCKYFPTNYPVAHCSVQFTGAGEIKINVTLVNFNENDQCDGFLMMATTFDTNVSSIRTDLCAPAAPTGLTTAGGKAQIEFANIAQPNREKYGFIFEVTSE